MVGRKGPPQSGRVAKTDVSIIASPVGKASVEVIK